MTTFPSWCQTALLLLATTQLAAVHSAGVQSGPHQGNTYAGGMVYDVNNEAIYVTGITYDPSFRAGPATASQPPSPEASCFAGTVYLNSWDWNDAGTFGSPNILETCQAIGYLAPSTVVLAGNSEPGGLANGNPSAALSAFALLTDKNDIVQPVAQTALYATRDDQIPYPKRIVSQNKDLYVISLTSTDDLDTSANRGTYPNWISKPKYGSSTDMSVTKLTLEQEEFLGIPDGPITLRQDWFQEFPISDAHPVFIGGVIVKNEEFLIVAGSTRGVGKGYGNAVGDDEDGFVTILSLATGELQPTRVDLARNNVRVGGDANDVLMGICDDSRDPKSFYIVGATQGDVGGINPNSRAPPSGSLQAWIMKMDIATLEPQWTVQLGARIPGSDSPSAVFAAGCAVFEDKVYMAGDVEEGAELILGNAELSSRGGDDLWVAQLDANTGAIQWAKQVGSAGSDNLSRNGGVITDVDGNVILFGETNGSLYRTRDASEDDSSSDVFLMVLDAEDGSHATVGTPVAPPTNAPVATAVPVPLPTPAPVPFNAVGEQFVGPIHAGALVYDPRNNRAVMTGSTFLDSENDSYCFMASVDLTSGSLINSKSHGQSSTNEACSAIAYSQLEDKMYTVGTTEANGFLLDVAQIANANNGQSDASATQIGMILQADNADCSLTSAALTREVGATYPVSVVAHPREDAIFVAVVGSDNPSANNNPGLDPEFPNFTSGGVRQYGDSYFVGIQRWDVSTSPTGQAPSPLGSQHFFAKYTTDDANINSAVASGMIMAGNGDTLVVVGSTKGSGGPFGTNTGSDMDGFILKIDPATGNLFGVNGQRSSTRLDSINQQDDWITGVCNDRFDNDAFYVVGATQGKVRQLPDNLQPPEGTTHAFVAKVNLQSLSAEWLRHFTMQPGDDPLAQASAYSCTVTNEGEGANLVYVAGVVEEGARMDDAEVTLGSGKDDIFVVQMDGATGDVNWIQQIGSPENERLGHGGSIDVDDDGNAIVFAETLGDFYGNRDGAPQNRPDAVVFTMNKSDGSYKPLTPDASLAGDNSAISDSDATLPPPPQPTQGTGVIPENIKAYQSGPDIGPTFAGGMFYDHFTNAIYVTGATYGSFEGPGVASKSTSSCFFGSMTLPDLEWREKETYGSTESAEACSALSISTVDGQASAFVAGSAEDGGGFLSQLGSGQQAEQAGILLDLANVDGRFKNQGGAVIDDDPIQFPIAVRSNDDGIAWVVSMTSKDTQITADFEKTAGKEYPNFTTGGIEKYGSKYRLVIERYELQRSGAADSDLVLEKSLQRKWKKPFETAVQKSVFEKMVNGLAQSKIRCLQLSDNRFEPNSIQSLSKCLRSNDFLRILHLAWTRMTEDDIVALSNALRFNTRLTKLVLYGCEIENGSMFRLSLRLRQFQGLKRLDLGGSQRFDALGRAALLQGLVRNTELETLVMTPNETTPEVVFWCDANRIGRRFLLSKEVAPSGLWPLVLARCQTAHMPKMWDTIGGSRSTEATKEEADRYLPSVWDTQARRASVLYYLLRNGPLLETIPRATM